jgi:hypothetical protein
MSCIDLPNSASYLNRPSNLLAQRTFIKLRTLGPAWLGFQFDLRFVTWHALAQ